MTDENDKAEHGKELCRLYRTLSAVHIAAVDYVRGDEYKQGKKIDEDAAAKRAKQVADFFQSMLEKDGLAIMTGTGGENALRAEFFTQVNDCEANGLCYDPIVMDCVPC